jgi:cysteinyl-tRNA synthetase
MSITLYNSKTRRKEAFVPINPQNVRMYVCGPTVYDRAHLGNARPAIVFDVLFRLLRHTYGTDHVTYVRNFTDVDDKINAKAAATGRSIAEICDETIAWYRQDMAAVGVMEPKYMPRATEYIREMVEMIETLIRKGFAYSKPISFGHNSRAVYFKSEKAPEHSFFHVGKYKRYGELSGRSLDEMISGARAEIGEGKLNPMDFVLWKPSTVDEPSWPSPWGYGRPGWHIECSAMSKALLGDTFDIHGGGLDLQFPHHENEIAQSCCANGTDVMANYWMHNEMLQVEGKKMSKSLGNFFTVRDLLDKGVAGEVIRFVMLSTHYRKPMDWTEAKAEQARNTLMKWASLVNDRPAVTTQFVRNEKHDPMVISAISEDLNTPAAITRLHQLYEIAQNVSNEGNRALGNLYHALEEFFGIDLNDFYQKLRPRTLDEQIERLRLLNDYNLLTCGDRIESIIEKRLAAKKNRDWALADELRLALSAAGVTIVDGAGGTKWELSPSFDPTKLENLR